LGFVLTRTRTTGNYRL